MTVNPPIILEFSGEATIRQAEAIALRLQDALAKAEVIEIDCQKISEVDITFIQLVIAARNSAIALHKSLVLNPPAQGPLLEALNICGIENSPGRDFWLGTRGE